VIRLMHWLILYYPLPRVSLPSPIDPLACTSSYPFIGHRTTILYMCANTPAFLPLVLFRTRSRPQVSPRSQCPVPARASYMQRMTAFRRVSTCSSNPSSLSPSENIWLPCNDLVKRGFEKRVLEVGTREAQRLGLHVRLCAGRSRSTLLT